MQEELACNDLRFWLIIEWQQIIGLHHLRLLHFTYFFLSLLEFSCHFFGGIKVSLSGRFRQSYRLEGFIKPRC